MSSSVVLESHIPNVPVRRGKVRDVYDLGDRLLLVASDRISAFDWVLPGGIPDKGRILTQISAFWFEKLNESNQVITSDVDQIELPNGTDKETLRGRSMLVRKTEVVPIECVVRGYLAGSGWKEYKKTGSVCGVKLPSGLRESDRLPEPILTPTTKAEAGHDEPITFERMYELVGKETAEEIRSRSLDVYRRGAEHAAKCGIIVADTKFEWGRAPEGIILIDEAMTPDSSRFWPVDRYEPGSSPPSFDKQYIRDWLDASDWDKNSQPAELPPEVVAKSREKYIEAYERLTGRPFAWK